MNFYELIMSKTDNDTMLSVVDNQFYIFGSQSSSDVDILVRVPDEIVSMPSHKQTQLCDLLNIIIRPYVPDHRDRPINCSLAQWDLTMTWCQKGAISETNNAICATYMYHAQAYPLTLRPIPRSIDDIKIKILSSIRVMCLCLGDGTITEDEAFRLRSILVQQVDEGILRQYKNILFRMYDVKKYLFRKYNMVMPHELLTLRKQLANLHHNDADGYQRIYNRSKEICFPIYDNLRSVIDIADRQNFEDDVVGCEFTMHQLCRFVTRSRIVGIQTCLLGNVDFTHISGMKLDTIKKLTFQLGQSYALTDGVELFTKEDVATHYPILADGIWRQHLPNITDLMLKFISRVYNGIITPTDTEANM